MQIRSFRSTTGTPVSLAAVADGGSIVIDLDLAASQCGLPAPYCATQLGASMAGSGGSAISTTLIPWDRSCFQ